MVLPAGRPALMGVLNVTPDSFSDGGLYLNPANAYDAALRMVDEGADIIDVGGESTRPGADSVDWQIELARVRPVVDKLAKLGVPVSIDTSKPEVAEPCLESGAQIINDVTALRSPGMVELAVSSGCTVCLMHMSGDPRTMQVSPSYGCVVSEVKAYLAEKSNWAMAQGVKPGRIWVDPGIGFGKTVRHNLELLAGLSGLCELSHPVLIGVSRKSFIGKILHDSPAHDRLEGTLAAQVVAQVNGASVIRAHDVKSSRRAIELTASVLGL